MYASKLLTERSPVVKWVMIAEASTDAPKSFCDAPDGTGTWTVSLQDAARTLLANIMVNDAGFILFVR